MSPQSCQNLRCESLLCQVSQISSVLREGLLIERFLLALVCGGQLTRRTGLGEIQIEDNVRKPSI